MTKEAEAGAIAAILGTPRITASSTPSQSLWPLLSPPMRSLTRAPITEPETPERGSSSCPIRGSGIYLLRPGHGSRTMGDPS